MSLETLASKCDGCGEKTFDYMTAGWLTFSGRIVGYDGRGKSGQAKTRVWMSSGHDTELHFCAFECMMEYGQRKAHGKG